MFLFLFDAKFHKYVPFWIDFFFVNAELYTHAALDILMFPTHRLTTTDSSFLREHILSGELELTKLDKLVYFLLACR